MHATITDKAVRITPSLRYIGPCTDKKTGQVYPARVLDKWTKPTVLDPATGEVVSRGTFGRRSREYDRWVRGFGIPDGKIRAALREIKGYEYPKPTKTRGEARKFSTGSVRRLRLAAWQLNFDYMITLTYDVIPDVRKAKDDLNRYLTWLRSVGVKQYLWVAELQKRGAIHYHIIIPNGRYCDLLRQRIKVCLDGREHTRPRACVAWGRCAHLPVRVWLSAGRWERIRSVESARSYVGKYISKTGEGSQEFAGRRWGSFRFQRRVVSSSQLVRTFFRLKGWKQKDVVIGTEADEPSVALLLRIHARINGESNEQEVRHLGRTDSRRCLP